MLSWGGLQLVLKSRQGRGRSRLSVPLEPFFGSTWPPLTPRPWGPCQEVLKVAPASSPGPVPGHLPLMDRPTDAGSGHRAASEVPEGPDPGPERVQPRVPLHVCQGACRRTGTSRAWGQEPRSSFWCGRAACHTALPWVGRCPPAGWAGETPVRQAHIHLQGGRPTLQTPGLHCWVAAAAFGPLGILPQVSPCEGRDETEKLPPRPPRASKPHVDPTCREAAAASRNCSGLSF